MQLEGRATYVGQAPNAEPVKHPPANEQAQTDFSKLLHLFTLQQSQASKSDTSELYGSQTRHLQALPGTIDQENSAISNEMLSSVTSLAISSPGTLVDMISRLESLYPQISGQEVTNRLGQALSELGLSPDPDNEAVLDLATLDGILRVLSSSQTLPRALPNDQTSALSEVVVGALNASSAGKDTIPVTHQAASVPPSVTTETSSELAAFSEPVTASQKQTAVNQVQSATVGLANPLVAIDQQTQTSNSLQPAISQAETEPLSIPVPQSSPIQAPTQVNGLVVDTPTALRDIPVLQQIVNTIVVTQAEGKTEARLILKPEALGQVLIQLQVHEGDISVRMLAETAQAQVAIRDQLSQLKSSLAAQGLQLTGFSIDIGRDASDFNNHSQHSQSQTQPDQWQRGTFLPEEQTEATVTQIANSHFAQSSINYQI